MIVLIGKVKNEFDCCNFEIKEQLAIVVDLQYGYQGCRG